MDSARELQYTTLDVFTSHRYAGSQLAIVHVPPGTELSQTQKQAIAREFNYAVTAFVFEHDNNANDDVPEWRINIFVPTAEIALAGQPLIGLACLLGQSMRSSNSDSDDSDIRNGAFLTRSARVPFTYTPSTGIGSVHLPHDILIHPVPFTPDLAAHHSFPKPVVDSMAHTQPHAPIVSLTRSTTFCLVELGSLEALSHVTADIEPLEIPGLDQEWKGRVGVMFFVRRGRNDAGEIRVRARVVVGRVEDAATGNAAAVLGVYFALVEAGQERKGLVCVEVEQGVEMGRRSVMGVEVAGDFEAKTVESVMLKGKAVPVMKGVLLVPA